MTSLPLEADKVDEGHVACSPHEWAQMVLQSQSIAVKDPQKNAKLWDFGIKDHVFSSGSELNLEEYLRLRVLWYTWTDQMSLRKYIRNNPALSNEKQQNTPYIGYISPENDRVADTIYNAIKPKLDGYLADIRRVGNRDPTQPSEDCGVFYDTRYWQGLVSVILKEVYDENGKEVLFKGKIRKSEAGMLQAGGSPNPPRTPTKQPSSHPFHAGYGTPDIARAGASAGGAQNRATSDESFVNTALLLMLQTITRLISKWEVAKEPRGQPESRSRPSSGSANSQAGSRASSPTSNHKRDDQTGDSSSSPSATAAAAAAATLARGLGSLYWLITWLPLSLVDRFSKAPPMKKLMEARVDGYLCRRDFVQISSDKDEQFKPHYNKLPLAILEAKPFTRLAALSATRWQEAPRFRLGSRDLMIAMKMPVCFNLLPAEGNDRHELWIIIAEYGDEWKQYIRGRKIAKPVGFSQSQEVEELAGSEGFVSMVKEFAPGRFDEMMDRANRSKKAKGSTRTSRGPSLDIPGPEYFCIMQQWGPFKTGKAEHMDLFIRRMIGLHVQLVQTWPIGEFQHPYPE